VVSDQIGSPTNGADLALAILTIIPKLNNENIELFHFSNEGECSWYDFADHIFKICNFKVQIESILSKDFSQLAKRPSYSKFNSIKISHKFNVENFEWKDSLNKLFKNKGLKNNFPIR
jgi:dTDP-4-dehydrorhamnose reductase